MEGFAKPERVEGGGSGRVAGCEGPERCEGPEGVNVTRSSPCVKKDNIRRTHA